MYYEFYIDVFFVVNLLMDFFVLCLTNQMIAGTASPLRSLGGAFMGAGGMCIFLVFSKEICSGRLLLFYSMMVVLMVHVGCGFKTLKKLLLGTGAFHGAAFLLGGFLTALPGMARREFLRFFSITVTAYLTIYTGIRLCKYLKGKGTVRCEVIIALGKKEMKVKGLYDTGNCLRDRETGKPVCVMEYSSFEKLLGKEQREALEQFCSMTNPGTDSVHMESLRHLKPRFLLYTSVGCQKGMLPVVTADSLTVLAGEKKRQVKDAAIGLSKTALSPYGNFQIIISPTILDSGGGVL